MNSATRGALLFVDACIWINLFATGRIEEILQALPFHFCASRYVAAEEVLTIRHASSTRGTERLDLDELARSARVSIFDIETQAEIAEFVRFAAELDDGEASTCALAVCRQGGVATDDRKALRVMARAAPNVPIHQTPELLQQWAALSGLSDEEVQEVLKAVRDRASFYPPRDAAGFSWWSSFLP